MLDTIKNKCAVRLFLLKARRSGVVVCRVTRIIVQQVQPSVGKQCSASAVMRGKGEGREGGRIDQAWVTTTGVAALHGNWYPPSA